MAKILDPEILESIRAEKKYLLVKKNLEKVIEDQTKEIQSFDILLKEAQDLLKKGKQGL